MRAYIAGPLFDPGERWEYGIAIDWIGLLVEKISAKSLGTYMQENIFSPLGMTSTGYRLTPDMEARRVAVHQRQERPADEVADRLLQPRPGRAPLDQRVDDALEDRQLLVERLQL